MSAIQQVHTFRALRRGQSEKAYYVMHRETGELMWIPKSQVLEPDRPFSSVDEEEITIPIWLAKEKGMV